MRAGTRAKVKADGVGDEGAAAAARRQLAEKLAAELLGALKSAGPR